MEDNSSVSCPEIYPTSTLRRGKNGKIYEIFPNGKVTELKYINDFTRGISDLDSNGTSKKTVIRLDGFPNSFKIKTQQTEAPPPKAQQTEAPPPEARPSEDRQTETRPSEDRQTEARPPEAKKLWHISDPVFQMDEVEEMEEISNEAVINQLPQSSPVKLLPQSNRFVDASSYSNYLDKPSSTPEEVTCCCNLLEMIFGKDFFQYK